MWLRLADPTGAETVRRGMIWLLPLYVSLLKRVKGLFGDKGSISQPLAQHLLVAQGVQLITRLRENMCNHLMPLSDQLLLRQRAIIETIYDQLRRTSARPSPTHHRSPLNFLVNLVCSLITYCHLPKKPSLDLDPDWELVALAGASLIPNSP